MFEIFQITRTVLIRFRNYFFRMLNLIKKRDSQFQIEKVSSYKNSC